MPARKKWKTASKLHNPYAGVPYAWQLTETIDDFLSRLPPATTEASEEVPWIFVCNPYISRKARPHAQSRGSRGNEDEAPEEEGTQLARAVEGGTERLHILTSFLGGLELAAKTKTVKTREANKERKAAVEDVLKLAHACRVRSGKVGHDAFMHDQQAEHGADLTLVDALLRPRGGQRSLGSGC